MNTEYRRSCPVCGRELPGTLIFCPVCMLRAAAGALVRVKGVSHLLMTYLIL
jgi:hypothetical protein